MVNFCASRPVACQELVETFTGMHAGMRCPDNEARCFSQLRMNFIFLSWRHGCVSFSMPRDSSRNQACV